MHDLWIGLAGGLASFAHCLGMCGGFALHLARGGPARRVLARQLLWHAGRTTTYVFLGALAGFGGSRLAGAVASPWLPRVLAWAAGGALVVAGAGLLGAFPAWRHRAAEPAQHGLFASLFRSLVAQPDARGALALGLATGFLPCPIVAALLVYALQSGTVSAGMLTLAGLGVGTAVPLLLAGLTGHALALRLRRGGAVLAGVVLILLGAITALRGSPALHRVLGCGAAHAPGAAGAPCCTGEAKP